MILPDDHSLPAGAWQHKSLSLRDADLQELKEPGHKVAHLGLCSNSNLCPQQVRRRHETKFMYIESMMHDWHGNAPAAPHFHI